MKIFKFKLKQIICICLFSILLFGCNKEGSNKIDQNGSESSDGVTLKNEQNSMVITGTGEKTTPKITMEKSAYIVNFKYKGEGGKQFEVFLPSMQSGFPPMSIAPFMGYAKDNSGWLVESKVLQWQSDKADVSFNIKASSPWSIEFKRFPLKDTPLQIPATLSGSGTQVTQLVYLKKGVVNFDISCPNTNKAGFMVTLYDGQTGQHVLPQIIIASNVEAGADPHQTEYSSSKKINIPFDGTYLLEIAANGNSPWEIKVSM